MVVPLLGLRERILPRVSRPNRYIAPFSAAENADARICLLYPGPYRRALAHPGFRTWLDALRVAAGSSTAIDICLCPEEDMDDALVSEGLPLFGLATHVPLGQFDRILVFAESPHDIPIALRMVRRGAAENTPVYLAGPLALWGGALDAFFHGVLAGDPEAFIPDVLTGDLAATPGVWRHGAEEPVEARWLSRFPTPPSDPWVPLGEVEPEGLPLEIARSRGVADAYYTAPMLFRESENAMRATERLFADTGCAQVVWGGAGADRHPELGHGLETLHRRAYPNHQTVTVDRIHPGVLKPALARELNKNRRAALKFLPVALSERLRREGGVPLDTGALVEALQLAGRGGWPYVDWPVLVGTPRETDEDRREFEALLFSLTQAGLRKTIPKLSITLHPYVPKPLTPGQDAPLLHAGEYRSWVLALQQRFKKASRLKLLEEDVAYSETAYGLLRGQPELLSRLRAHVESDGFVGAPFQGGEVPRGAAPVPSQIQLGRFPEPQPEPPVPAKPPVMSGRTNGRRIRRGPSKHADRYRVRFSKGHPLRFASHLEVVRALERAFLGAQVPLVWSQGKDPRPKLAFGPSLAVGMTSEAEYLDMALSRETGETFLTAVNARLPQGLVLTHCSPIRNEAASLGASIDVAAYRVSFPRCIREDIPSSPDLRKSFETGVRQLLDSDALLMTKTKKEKTITINARPSILSAAVTQDSVGYPAFDFRIRLNRPDTIRPESLAGSLCTALNVDERMLCVHRTALYVSGGRRDLDPMQVIQPEFAWWRETLRGGVTR